MSGTFKDLNVPPTLVSFAVDVINTGNVVSTEFKEAASNVVLLPLDRDKDGIPDFEQLDRNYTRVYQLCTMKKVLSSHTVRAGGIAEAISKMCFGNMIGFAFGETIKPSELFAPEYGSIMLEIEGSEDLNELLSGIEYRVIGKTQTKQTIDVNGISLDLNDLLHKWGEPLESIFPTKTAAIQGNSKNYLYAERNNKKPSYSFAKPRIFIPVFPGTSCEYDTARAFEKAGGLAEVFIVNNLSPKEIDDSIDMMAKKIDNSQIIMIPGGSSVGDEPDGAGKFITTAFRNPKVKDAIMRLLKDRDGLMLGISNGFQALIKLGLVPYGEIRDFTKDSPTLTFNTIGRHVSCMVRTKITSTLSPWLSNVNIGDVHTVAVSHGEGRFVASSEVLQMLERNGQIATQYVDMEGNATYDIRFNPNGSYESIECITSPDGRVLGKMGHSERIGSDVAVNIQGNKDQRIFDAGVGYFKG